MIPSRSVSRWYRPLMVLEPEPSIERLTVQPCPGHHVVAICDLPPGTHSRNLVKAGTSGEIVRTPAYFNTTYSIRFVVHGTDITLHGVNRHEFRVIEQEATVPVAPGFPPTSRYPQPHRVAPTDSQ